MTAPRAGIDENLPCGISPSSSAVLSPPLRKERKHGRFGYGITWWQKIG